jgi:hypothetical protein
MNSKLVKVSDILIYQDEKEIHLVADFVDQKIKIEKSEL